MPHQCRQLKAKRLPSASRHQDKQILSGECILDDFFLQRPELFVAKMFLQGTEQFHDFLSKTLRAFRPANFVPQGSDDLGSRYLPFLVSGSALDRQHFFDLVRLAAIDGRLAAFVVKRLNDHFEFTVAIQIKYCGEVVYIRQQILPASRSLQRLQVLFEHSRRLRATR